MVWTLESQEPLDVKDEGFQHCLLTATTHSPFLSTVSYHQGVLSATILYEILLGKAALYAVLVSALVLMAVVRMAGWGKQLKGAYRLLNMEWKGISEENPLYPVISKEP